MTNKTIIELAEINDTSREVRRRRLNWLVHILRREGENDCCTALGCVFSVYASKLSNSLPIKLKKKNSCTVDTFKNKFKTFLFNRTFC